MMSLWDALRMNMMISYQELVRTFLSIFKLPIPAPPVLPGIIGIVGVYLGSKGYHVIMQIIS
ncbi:XapX domain-containing protein [Klebsiella pneumoniae]|uniref:XapX domain-containing protein n=1 Tax=Klebsiella pneumoniae TaxID=573 RepID=UPI003C2E1772